MYYTSGFWKRRARAALQNHWLTALLIALIVSLPSLLVQTAAAVTENDLLGRLQELMLSSVSVGGNAVDLNRFQTGLEAIRGSTGIWVMQGLYLAAWLLTPCLTLGQVAWLLGRLRCCGCMSRCGCCCSCFRGLCWLPPRCFPCG